MLTSPAPCSPAGALMSDAVPSWVLEYASITSAAAPATNGADWLVPPNASVNALVGHPAVTSGLHAASPPYPGATRSTTLPAALGSEGGWAVPVGGRVARLSLVHDVNPYAWAVPRSVVVAPTPITSGSSA